MQNIYYTDACYTFYHQRRIENYFSIYKFEFSIYKFEEYARNLLIDKHYIFLYHLKTIDSRR